MVTRFRRTTVLDSDADGSAVGRFHGGLLCLAGNGLLHETQIAQHAGVQAVTAAATEWTASVKRIGGCCGTSGRAGSQQQACTARRRFRGAAALRDPGAGAAARRDRVPGTQRSCAPSAGERSGT
jgi:hypothetical protein